MAALPSQTKVGEMLPHAILLLVLTPVISYFVLISAWVAEARRIADGACAAFPMPQIENKADNYSDGVPYVTPAGSTKEDELRASLRSRVERFNKQTDSLDRAETAAEAHFYCSLLNLEEEAKFWRITALSLSGECARAKQYYTNSSMLRLYTLWNELNPADHQADTEQDAWYFLQGKLGPPVVTIVDERVEITPE